MRKREKKSFRDFRLILPLIIRREFFGGVLNKLLIS